jgi:hypothetical protein
MLSMVSLHYITTEHRFHECAALEERTIILVSFEIILATVGFTFGTHRGVFPHVLGDMVQSSAPPAQQSQHWSLIGVPITETDTDHIIREFMRTAVGQ